MPESVVDDRLLDVTLVTAPVDMNAFARPPSRAMSTRSRGSGSGGASGSPWNASTDSRSSSNTTVRSCPRTPPATTSMCSRRR
ncbi:hypothetical protein GXW82_09900 [Streptacidiphilus sp. 4-A2]|nr:hypothetical protein [Streptacidiphilus sp. 4-A2]